MHLATLAAATLAVLSTACTIVVQAEPTDDESESTSTTAAASSFPEQAESSSTGEPEDGSSTGREIGSSTGEAEVDGETSTGDDTTGEVEGTSEIGESSSTSGDTSTSSDTTTGDDEDSSTGVIAKAFGEACEEHTDCESSLCYPDTCTVACTQAVANDCGGLGVAGLCVAVVPELWACVGDLTFGDDTEDDARLNIFSDGDFLARSFQSAADADLFLLDLPAGVYSIDAAPVVADVQLELYDHQAAELGVINDAGEGLPEAVEVDHTGGVLFVVVRSVGQQSGDHTFNFVTK